MNEWAIYYFAAMWNSCSSAHKSISFILNNKNKKKNRSFEKKIELYQLANEFSSSLYLNVFYFNSR